MKISGLSIQGKTRDGLFEYVQRELRTPSEEKWRALDERHNAHVRTMLNLLYKLETLDGPDVWIGTSWGSYNFNLRDVIDRQGGIRAVVHVQAFEISREPLRFGYRFHFDLTGCYQHEMNHEVSDLDEACAIIVRLLKSQQAQQPARYF